MSLSSPPAVLSFSGAFTPAVATPVVPGPFILDAVYVINTDTIANGFKLFQSFDGGVTWVQLVKTTGLGVGASFTFAFGNGGLYLPFGLAVSNNAAITTSGLTYSAVGRTLP